MEKSTTTPQADEAISSSSGTYSPSDEQTNTTAFSTLEVVRPSNLEAYKRASETTQPTTDWQSKNGQYAMFDQRFSDPGTTTSVSAGAALFQQPPQKRICGLPKRLFWIIFATVVGVCVIAAVVGGAVGGTRHRDESQSSNVEAANGAVSASSSSPQPTTAFITVTVAPTSMGTTSLPSTLTTTTSATTTTTSVCVAGTGVGNYVGLCSFACSYGYCPAGPCTCTSSGTPVPTPPTTGVDGIPLSSEDDSYLGLCSYCCNHGYCPASACTTKAS